MSLPANKAPTSNNRIYATTTTDFGTFTPTRLLYDGGFNVIDATLAENGREWLMFVKNETLTPRPEKMDTMKVGNDDVKIGKFDVEKLVDLSKHNYTLEPNLTFTPDNKWIVFRSNIQGGSQVYAVEIAKAK